MQPVDPRILTINGGSSSIKFAMFEGDDLRRVVEGTISRIGLSEATLRVVGANPADNQSQPLSVPNYDAAVGALMSLIRALATLLMICAALGVHASRLIVKTEWRCAGIRDHSRA